MYRTPTLFALLLTTGLPAFAHPGDHDPQTFVAHMASSPFHWVLPLLGIALLGVVLKRSAVIRVFRERTDDRKS